MSRPSTRRLGAGLVWLLVVLAGCVHAPRPCDSIDPALAASSFVIVEHPAAGQPVSSPLRVRGCSRTFEANVVWELRSHDGRILASGHATGGGISGPEAFSFSAAFRVAEAQRGHLRVLEPTVSETEGHPGPRMVVPLALLPASE